MKITSATPVLFVDRVEPTCDFFRRLGFKVTVEVKEKEAACAAFGEVARKYPRAAANIKQQVDREQKRVKC